MVANPSRTGLDHPLLPLGITLLAVVLGFFCLTVSSRDDAAFLLFGCLTPALLFSLVFLAIRKRAIHRFETALLISLLLGSVWLLGKNFMEVRTIARWSLYSKSLEERTLATDKSDGYLRHTEWDEWGFAGVGNGVEYVVFDPENTLSTKANGKAYSQINGIPCGPAQVGRLENHWYVVRLWIDNDWDHCNS